LSFSYGLGANPLIDYPRLLISDTQETNYVFEDEEITAARTICGLNWQSGMQYSPPSGANLPTLPINYLRIAALLLDALAANKSRLASIKQLLDVKMDSSDAAIQLRATAAEYRDVDDNSMAFVIIEQCHDLASFRERWWKQVQRQTAG
jgi:hypothetical protein